jgi:RNA polymerase sigma factor (TIGR02999 family)
MSGEVTRILDSLEQGNAAGADELLPLIYDELRRLAAAKMANEAPGQTLQPTALVHEAWLRLGADKQPNWQNRGHFFGAAAEAMRRILVENARRKARLRHGGQLQRVDLTSLDIANTSDDEQVLAVSEALDKLAARDPVGAELIKLRFFVGVSQAEAAQLLGLPERTAGRAWAFARAWLHEELKKGR